MAFAICSLLVALFLFTGCGGPSPTPGDVGDPPPASPTTESDEIVPSETPGSVVTQARALVKAGNRADALAILEGGLERFPESGEIHAELGTHLIADGPSERGRRYLEKAMQGKGDAARRAHRTLAEALFKQESYDEAGELLDSYRQHHPGDFSVDMQAGWIHFEGKRYDAAAECYRSAAQTRPESVDARVGLAKSYEKLDRRDTAIRAYDKAIKMHGLDRRVAPLVLAQANLLNKTGRHDRALALVEQCQGAFPLTAGLECALGMALAGEGRYDDAIEAFGRATGDAQYMDFAYEQIRRVEQLRRQSR